MFLFLNKFILKYLRVKYYLLYFVQYWFSIAHVIMKKTLTFGTLLLLFICITKYGYCGRTALDNTRSG